MKIRKSEEKNDKRESGLATRDEPPWMMNPFRDFDTYADRFFTDIWRDFPELRGRLMGPRWAPGWMERGGGHALKAPATDLKDTGRQFVLRAEMPGVGKEDVDVTIHSDSVEIKAQRQSGREEEHEGFYYSENGKSSYYRRIPLPEEVEAEKADGDLQNGVLHLTLPKSKPTDAKAHKLKLQ